MSISKVILNGTTLIDATTATAAASDITSPKTAMLADGVMTTGTGSGGGYSEEDINMLVSGSLSGDLIYTATSIGRAFANTTGSFSLSFPNATSIKNVAYLMESCGASSVSFPELNVTVNGNFLKGCSAVVIFAPQITINDAFAQNSSNLETVVIGSFGTRFQQLNNCPKLKTVDASYSTGKIDNTFQSGCSNLDTFILRGSSILQLYTVTSFDSTKFKSGGTGGIIYIPESLYNHLGDGTSSDYKAATNWSVIDGYGTITWAKIEGSYYETHYADGTEIPTT